MSEIEEQENLQNDFEVEIISLDKPSIVSECKTIPLVLLPTKLRSTQHQSKKVLLLAIGACTVLLTFLVIPSIFPILQSTSQQAVLTPIQKLPVGYDSFFIDKDVPWMKVFVDGHQVQLPRMGVKEPLKLGNGHHIIVWRADPFQQQTCLVSIPFTIDDSCRFALNQVVYKSFAYQVILLRESLNTLPYKQRQALVSAIQLELGKLSTSETVHLGEQYASESGPVTARQPLRATLNFQLDSSSNWVCFAKMQTHEGLLCGIDKQDCRQLCSAPWQFRQHQVAVSVPSGWSTLVMTRSSWDFATEDGRIIVRDQPIGLNGPGQGQQLLLLRITWDGAWHVKVLLGSDLGPPMYTNSRSGGVFGQYTRYGTNTVQVPDDPACNVARQIVLRELGVVPQNTGSTTAIVHLVSSSNPVIGCLVVSTTTEKTATMSAPILSTTYFLVRFGVLLAANPVAYRLQPRVPRVDAYELNLVRQLATLPGQPYTDAVGEI